MNKKLRLNLLIAFLLFVVMALFYKLIFTKNDEVNPAPTVFETVSPDKIQEGWVEISDIALDIRYATENNFTNEQLYPCGRCYLIKEAAQALLKAQQKLKKQNLSLVLFDCYRPLSVQKRLWEITPDPSYVTPPDKGSMHNRGLAVDISIIDETGMEVDMGTAYDYFGRKAHVDFYDLPDRVLKNRKILNDLMIEFGFKGIRTEWWHFSYLHIKSAVEHWEWDCPPNK